MSLPGIGAALRGRAQRLLRHTLAALLAGLCTTFALGFASLAGFLALQERLGTLNAAIILAAIHALAAGLIVLLLTRRPAPLPASTTPPDLAALLAAIAPEQAALTKLASELGRDLTPVQLTLAALIGGLISGRSLGR